MSTILHFHLPNVVAQLDLRLSAPPLSRAAQTPQVDPSLLWIVAGLLLLLILVLVLFWRLRRKPPAEVSLPAAQQDATPAPPSVAISLDFIAESDQRMSVSLDKPTFTIGRASDNDIVITTPVLKADTVSQHHARLRRDPDGYVVRDLGSTNGVTVNGRRTLENLLQDGDRVQFGEAEAIFHQAAGGAA